MSRLYKYKESSIKFFNDKCNISDKEFIQSHKIDQLLSVVLLTILNNQQKKNSFTVQGYYAASFLQCLQYLYLTDDLTIKTNIIVNSYKLLWQNLDILKNINNPKLANTIINNVMNYWNSNADSFINNPYPGAEFSNRAISQELKNWYLKDELLIAKLDSLKKINIATFNKHTTYKTGKLINMAVSIGFLLGGGERGGLMGLKKLITYFTNFYQLYLDFINISIDLENATTYSMNYIINFGIQSGYDYFMNNKQLFIEECMKKDMLTATIKEIITYMSNTVDNIIDLTSPDLRSISSNTNS